MYKRKTSVYFRCDASYDIGGGHLMRCLSLASAFQQFEAMHPVFITANMDKNFAKFIKQAGCTHVVLNKSTGEADNASEAISVMKRERRKTAPLCVIDSYDITGDYERKLKREGIFVVAIDDMSVRNFYSDIIINYHIGAKAKSYKHASYTRFLLGTSYAPLRCDFMDTSTARRYSNVGTNILVTLGGGSLANHIVRNIIIESLCLLKNKMDVNAVIVASLSEEDKKVVMNRARSSGLKLNILSNVTNMAQLMLECELAVAAGGITAYELAACGLPSLFFILGENQKGVVESFAGENLGVNLGWHEMVSPEMLADAINNLRNNPAKCQEMSHRGRRLIDGKGCMRIVKEVARYY